MWSQGHRDVRRLVWIIGHSIFSAVALTDSLALSVSPNSAVQYTCTCTALGVLCCFALFVCLTLLASFFHLSFILLFTAALY